MAEVHSDRLRRARPRLRLGALIGSGDRIGAVAGPFLLVGALLNVAFPEAFSVGGPPPWLQAVSALILAAGVVAWAWSVLLILTRVPSAGGQAGIRPRCWRPGRLAWGRPRR